MIFNGGGGGGNAKQLLDNSQTARKSPENWFLNPENCYNDPLRRLKCNPKFRFYWSYISVSSRKYTKRWVFKAKNKA